MLTQSAPAAPATAYGSKRRRGRGAVGARALAWRLLSTTLLVAVYVTFAVAHFEQWRRKGQPAGLGLVVEEGLVAVLFLLRRTPKRTSTAPGDWVAAALGSWLVLLLRPGGAAGGYTGLGLAVQLAGLAGVVLSLSTLGRSFGIVAADRGLKTSGPYAVVRHPTYLCYLVTQAGYLIQFPTVWNAGIVLAATAFQIRRIVAEELVLAESVEYRAYRTRTRHRLLPGIW